MLLQLEKVILQGWTPGPPVGHRPTRVWAGMTGTKMAEPVATLREVWGEKSWLVDYGGPYWNETTAHRTETEPE